MRKNIFLFILSSFLLLFAIEENPVYGQENTNIDNSQFQLYIGELRYSEKAVTLSWDMVANSSNYIILTLENDIQIELARTNELTANISLAEYGKHYSVYVAAYDINGQLLACSDVVDIFLPNEVKKIKTTSVSKKCVKIAWEASEGCNKYEVYEKKSEDKYKLVAETSDNSIRTTVEKNKKYSYKIVAVYVSDLYTLSTAGKQKEFDNGEFVDISHQKYTYSEMVSDIKSICNKYSDYVSYKSIGRTKQNRQIYDVILGNPDAKKSLLVVSTLHAREYVATVTCMKQLEYYLLNYNSKVDNVKPADIFNKCCIHYIMMANPDGVMYSQTKKSTWKANANGVNLNNNFPYRFKKSGRAKYGTYTGKKALCENETKAIAAITKQLAAKGDLAVVNYHAMGEIVFGDYSGKNKALKRKINNMYSIARKTTGYSDAGGYGGKSNGSYRDYLSYVLKIPSITIEVGSTPCPVNKRYYNSIFNKNKYVILREAQAV